MNRYNLVVLTNAKPGRDKEFNDWYTDIHIPDVLDVPGVMAAQRFKLGDEQRRPGPHPYGYMAIYEVETDDLGETIEALKVRSGTPAMPLSDAMEEARVAWFFEPITERKTR